MSSNLTLAQASIGQPVEVVHVGGQRSFRLRLMELGLVPGTLVTVRKVAPLGDPLELSTRGCTLSIRRAEAQQITVSEERRAAAE